MENGAILQGVLEEIRVPEILCNLFRRKETGSLHFQREKLEKTFYFDEGRIVFSASSDPDERLGIFLLKQNRITYKQLLECAPKVNSTNRLGSILVMQGILLPNDLYHAVIDQTKEIVLSVFDWPSGKFQFHSGPLRNESITLNTSTPDLIMAGMERIKNWSWIQAALPSLETVYRKCEGWSPVVRKLTMSREMEAILDLFDRPRTLQEVLQLSALGSFETCRLLWSFLILSVIEEILVVPLWTGHPVEAEGEPPETKTQPLSKEETTTTPQRISEPGKETKESTPSTGFAEAPSPTLSIPAQELAALLADPVPFSELSFSDLADWEETEEKATQTTAAMESEEAPALQPWENLIQPSLTHFNELHRYLYEMVSLELGSGTSSFLSKAFKKASIKYPLVFEGVTLNDFGELSESVLLANIQGNLVTDYGKALDSLLAEERSMISLFLDLKRVDVIEAGLKRILARHQRALT